MTDEDWSSPAKYGPRLQPVPEPMLVAHPGSMADSMVFPDWPQIVELVEGQQSESGGGLEENPWSVTTYAGRRKHRPRSEPPTQRSDEGLANSNDTPDSAYPGSTETNSADPTPPAQTSEHESNRRVLASSRRMALASLISRVTGFLRSILLVAALGLNNVSDTYNSANTLPNMVYELLLGGVLSSVLIPLLVSAQHSDDDDGQAYTQRLLSIATAALGAITLLAVAAAPVITAIYVQAGPKRDLTSVFATLLLPEIFFYGLGALIVAVLNTRGVYGPGAWSPVLNNIIVIATVVVYWLTPGPSTPGLPGSKTPISTAQILVIGVGTTLGIVAQSLVLIPYLRRCGFHWRWRFKAFPHEAGRLRETGQLVGWVVGYVLASQIGLSVVIRIANDYRGGLSKFSQTDLLFQMPYGILGVSLLTAIMPRMSRAAARGDHTAVVDDLSLAARLSGVALIPVTTGLIVLAPAFTSVIFSLHNTGASSAREVGVALALASFGLVPFAVVMLQLRVFYAFHDARTPTLINVVMVAVKIVLSVLASHLLSAGHVVVGLNVCTSLSYLVGAVVGHMLLTRRLGHIGFMQVLETWVRMGVAAVIGAVAAWVLLLAIQTGLGNGDLGEGLGFLVGAAGGAAVMVAVALRLKVSDVQEIMAAARRRR